MIETSILTGIVCGLLGVASPQCQAVPTVSIVQAVGPAELQHMARTVARPVSAESIQAFFDPSTRTVVIPSFKPRDITVSLLAHELTHVAQSQYVLANCTASEGEAFEAMRTVWNKMHADDPNFGQTPEGWVSLMVANECGTASH